MTQYKIQVGSWTKLPDGKVQEDTRDIMEMMADDVGGKVENYRPSVNEPWEKLGIITDYILKVYDGTDYKDQGLVNQTSLFIPYEELQKMLKAPKEQEVPKVSSLLNTKLDCRKADGTIDEELSRAFQEACFEQGIPSGSILNNRKFLFNTEGHHGVTWGDSEAGFDNHENTQINFKYHRTLTWEATEIEPVTPEPVDEMVDICGVEYSAKELSEALALIKSARKG